MKFVSSSEIQKNSGFLTEISVLLFFRKIEFLRFYRKSSLINLIVYCQKNMNEKYDYPFEHGVKVISKQFFYPLDPSEGESLYVHIEHRACSCESCSFSFQSVMKEKARNFGDFFFQEL